jgi:hypothetical protein
MRRMPLRSSGASSVVPERDEDEDCRASHPRAEYLLTLRKQCDPQRQAERTFSTGSMQMQMSLDQTLFRFVLQVWHRRMWLMSRDTGDKEDGGTKGCVLSELCMVGELTSKYTPH